MDKIKVGDFVKIEDWDKYFLVTEVSSTDIWIYSSVSNKTYKYNKGGYSMYNWIIRGPVEKRKSGFGKWVKAHGI